MIIERGQFKFELSDEWITEAQFNPLNQNGFHYKVDSSAYSLEEIFYVQIDAIYPKTRAKGVPIFKSGEVNGKSLSAKNRTVFILSAIANGSPLPPVEVVNFARDEPFKFKLVAGCHRLHCSIAAGFTHIPAVYGVDITDPNL